MNIILILSLFIGFGYLIGKLAEKVKLPTVSGYLIAGVIIGFFPINLTNHLPVFDTISEITLSFIAFGIGSEFVFSSLKKSGKRILTITFWEVLGAVLIVSLAMYLMTPFAFPTFTNKERLVFSLILGSMSAATAPAATILVIKQFRSDGPVTRSILPVAALDDVLGIIVFGIVLPIARILVPIDPNNALKLTAWNILKGPLIEVFGSLLIGLLLGILLSILSKKVDPKDNIQVKTIFFILVGLGVSKLLNLSPLLVNIMIGTTLANLRKDTANRSFKTINDFVPIFYILFFTIAGATLKLDILKTVGLIGVVYIIARALGKITGSHVGAVISNAESNVKKYLGFALLPQGGISIGLSLLVNMYLPTTLATPITTIILFSILIYESTGPIFAKIALDKSNELYALVSNQEIND
ncbi:cation:proton antiporter [Haploplasma axanthum]|uniref:NhaP-type Na+/H+ and K+/H+ antiporters n=1 Tax=Haploplasma axanthum TaxID=29552 RepID=A0A449BDV0_HAPAX|nr:cation:proton antiporter [Haploplasma axanthum]VEU80633.1 NhaP-type Na+/H+ and K+/H+ antiporters [Haploplasma axanthum]